MRIPKILLGKVSCWKKIRKKYILRGTVIFCSESSPFFARFSPIFTRKHGNLPIDGQLWTWIVQKRWQIETLYLQENIYVIFLSRILWHVWDGHVHRSPTDRVYKIILWNKFGIVGNPLGHQHADYYTRELLFRKVTGVGGDSPPPPPRLYSPGARHHHG